MVMPRNLDLAARQLLHRMISAMMAKFELKGLAAERDAGQLMPQANPEDRLASHESPNVIDSVSTGLGITGPGRQGNSVRLQCKYVLRRGLRRNDGPLAALSAQLAQNVLLDAEIIGDHMKARRLVFYSNNLVGQVRALSRLPHICVIGRDHSGEILAIHLRDRQRFGYEFVGVSLERGDHTSHHAVVP